MLSDSAAAANAAANKWLAGRSSLSEWEASGAETRSTPRYDRVVNHIVRKLHEIPHRHLAIIVGTQSQHGEQQHSKSPHPTCVDHRIERDRQHMRRKTRRLAVEVGPEPQHHRTSEKQQHRKRHPVPRYLLQEGFEPRHVMPARHVIEVLLGELQQPHCREEQEQVRQHGSCRQTSHGYGRANTTTVLSDFVMPPCPPAATATYCRPPTS